METFSFRITEEENQALNTLANRLGCNRAEAARRAIRLAHQVIESNTASSISPDHLREIIESQKSIIELLIELAKFKSLTTRLDHLEEYAVQACLSSGMLAKQAGLFETAKKEFSIWKENNREKHI